MTTEKQNVATNQLGIANEEITQLKNDNASLTQSLFIRKREAEKSRAEIALLKNALSDAQKALTKSELPFYEGMKILNKYAQQ